MLVQDIPLGRIQIRDRSRSEIRNVPSLAASIRDRGLLQPVVVRRDGTDFVLVAGGRRIEALKSLGRATVAAHVAESLNDELEALLAEGEENTEREPFTPSEAVAHAERIEAIEKRKAQERQREGRRAGGEAKARVQSAPGVGAVPLDFVEPTQVRAEPAPGVMLAGNFPASSPAPTRQRPEADRTRDRVAKATGMSGRTLEKARRVVDAAKDESAPAPVREAAREAVETMDRTGKVDPAYRKVRDTRAALADAPLDDLLAQDDAIKRAKLRAAITSSVIQVRNSLPKLSPEHCAEAMESEQWEEILRAQEILDEWIEKVRNLRKPAGLKLVK